MIKELVLTALVGVFSFASANVKVVVSIVPAQTIVSAIGGDKVISALMVTPGSSPHTYEPKPSQMKDISEASLYFSVGAEFEEAWLPKFKNQNKNMKIVDLGKGVSKIAMEKHTHGEHKQDSHKHGKLDTHIWTNITNIKIMAKNVFDALVASDSLNTPFYKANLEKFIAKLNDTDKQIKDALKNTKAGTKFMVFHPAWGYFASQYKLTQFSIEVEGKNPTPKQIAYIIDEAKEEKIKAVFTAPEFSEKVALQIAKEVGVPVVKISALNPKVCENLIALAKAIGNK